MKQFLAELFIWWHKQTLSIGLRTWLKGRHVGTDEFGNKYYTDKKNKKRWVVYDGIVEASAIPPGWHGWMHYRTDILPNEENYQPHKWEKPHIANPTGTRNAYHPKGSLLRDGKRAKISADYEAWKPE